MDYMDMVMGMLVIAVIAFTLGIVGTGALVSNIGSSSGQHTGIVTAVEHNSNIVWAADIVYFKTDSQSSQEDRYCVNDESVKHQLELFAKEKREDVTIHYSNDFLVWRWQCNGGDSIITRVEPSLEYVKRVE